MYRALYREYRPETFEEVIGQDHIVKILKTQIAQDSVSHAYLFCGTRGTGKTTTARLLAKGVNCTGSHDDGAEPAAVPCGKCDNCRSIKEGTFMDLIEIDAASNNGVENIRELRESVNYPPAVGRKKIYIIDEVHMLSNAAFNALLKTLEEPPEFDMFILCTTEPEKLPATILSRCMRMDFKRVPEDRLLGKMREICRDIGASIDEEALRMIAAQADGSARDGLTLLDQCVAGRSGKISTEDVLDSLGAVGTDKYIELTDKINARDVAGGLLLIDEMMKGGKDARQILQGLMTHYRGLLMATFIESPQAMLGMSDENAARLSDQALVMSVGSINAGIIEIAEMLQLARKSSQPRVILEMCFIKLATYSDDGRTVVLKAARPAASGKMFTGAGQDGAPEPGREEHGKRGAAEKKEESRTGDGSRDERSEGADASEAAVITGSGGEAETGGEGKAGGPAYDLIWKAVVSDVIEMSDSHMIMLLQNTEFVSADEGGFRIHGSKMAESVIEDNRAFIEKSLSEHCGGQKIKITVCREDTESEGNVMSDQEMMRAAKSAEAVLGIPVETE